MTIKFCVPSTVLGVGDSGINDIVFAFKEVKADNFSISVKYLQMKKAYTFECTEK